MAIFHRVCENRFKTSGIKLKYWEALLNGGGFACHTSQQRLCDDRDNVATHPGYLRERIGLTYGAADTVAI